MNENLKRKIRRNSLLIIAVIALVFGCATSFAAVKTSTGVHNIFSTGGINIKVQNYQMQDGERTLQDKKTVVDYYGKASFIPCITNKAESCYVRVKLTAETESQQIDIVKDLYGIGDDWKAIGEYLYYIEPLENKESVDVCEGFDVPDEWDYMTSNNMSINVSADAIQSKNFTPDFNSENPWGDVTILESKVKDDYTINAVGRAKGDGNIKVVYANEIEGITINSDNFFEDVAFMPGDEYSDSIKLTNNTDKTATILFKTEFEDSALLKMLQMDIDNGENFYTGSVADDSLKEYQKIAVLEPGEEQEINVTLTLPDVADNNYQMTNDKSTWYFAIEQEQDKAVKTGDDMALWLLAALCFGSGIVAFVAWKGKRKSHEENI